MKPLLTLLLSGLLALSAPAQPITVAAAISLKDALTSAAREYKTETGQSVEFTFASSGQLANQIKTGAPIDLFISAGNKQVDDLSKAGAIDDASRTIVAGNSLVLIVPADAKSPPDSLNALTGNGVAKIAIGEPKTVPAGQYAQQALKHVGIGDAVKEKLIFGANVRQVLDYVERGEVSAGLVYATDAKIAGDKVRVAASIDAAAHEPIVYPAAIIKDATNSAAARKFLDFIKSEKGQSALKSYGFSAPPGDKPTK